MITKQNDKLHNIHGFCLLFLHNIQPFNFFFLSVQGRKKLLMYNNYYFKPSKYCLIYFIIVDTLACFLSFFETAIKTQHNRNVVGKKSWPLKCKIRRKVKAIRVHLGWSVDGAAGGTREGGPFSVPHLTFRLRRNKIVSRKKKHCKQKQKITRRQISIYVSIIVAQSSTSNQWRLVQVLLVLGSFTIFHGCF